jgi:hypothetical protein
LSQFVKRNHISICNWIQRCSAAIKEKRVGIKI